MLLPPLYKYLDINGAKLTLGNQTFRHAKPSSFNDDMDMTLQNVFPEDIETACQIFKDNFVDVQMDNLEKPSNHHDPEIRMKANAVRKVLAENPNRVKLIKDALRNGELSDVYDVGDMADRTGKFIEEINEFLQGYRVLCVSQSNSIVRMWERYAENHRGIVLRITPNVAKDSPFQMFKRVEYFAERPTMYPSAMDFLRRGGAGDQSSSPESLLHNLVYSKTFEWEYEQEFRLAVPVPDGDNSWDFPLYHSDEIAELYFGANMHSEDKSEIMKLAIRMNREIVFYQVSVGAEGRISFQKLS